MTEKYDLSRRKVLAGLGTIGVAGAGAGLGTSAYFSDQETFTNNQLVAGELDMKVGWEEHYSDWMGGEGDGVGDVNMVSNRTSGNATSVVGSGNVGLPSNVAALISVNNATSANTFLDNTQEDKFPSGYESENLPDDIDCSPTPEGDRNDNGDIAIDIDDDGSREVVLADDDDASKPIIELDDVKPGDFGEVTFSFALCDNPGYVWAGAFLRDAMENGITEPEADDEDEEETQERPASGDSDSDVVELLDELKVAVWLDNGNNFQDCGEQPLTVGSLRDVINGNAPNINNNGLRLDGRNEAVLGSATELTAYGVNRFDLDGSGGVNADFELVDDPVDSGKVAKATSKGEATPDYITSAVCIPEQPTLNQIKTGGGRLTYEYYEGEENENAAPDEAIILVRDNNDDLRVFSRTWNDGDGASTDWRTRNVGLEVTDDFGPNSGRDWIEVNDDNTTTPIGPSLLGNGGAQNINGNSNVLALAVARGNADPSVSRTLEVYYRNPSIGNLGDDPGPFPTSCFRGERVYHGVFAWWLPVDHGNEVQTDSVTFDLGLYTEQCRHNEADGPTFGNR